MTFGLEPSSANAPSHTLSTFGPFPSAANASRQQPPSTPTSTRGARNDCSPAADSSHRRAHPGCARVRFAVAIECVYIVSRLPYTAIVGDIRDATDPNYCALASARSVRLAAFAEDACLRKLFRGWSAASRHVAHSAERQAACSIAHDTARSEDPPCPGWCDALVLFEVSGGGVQPSLAVAPPAARAGRSWSLDTREESASARLAAPRSSVGGAHESETRCGPQHERIPQRQRGLQRQRERAASQRAREHVRRAERLSSVRNFHSW